MSYVEIPAKLFLEEFAAALGLGVPVVSWKPAPDGLYIMSVQVNMGPADRVPFVHYETAGATIPEAEQVVSLMVIYDVATERQVEIRDINYPLVVYQHHQMEDLRKKLVETEPLCIELMNIVRSSENEVAFLEFLAHRFYHRIRYLKDTIATLQCGGGSSSSSS